MTRATRATRAVKTDICLSQGLSERLVTPSSFRYVCGRPTEESVGVSPHDTLNVSAHFSLREERCFGCESVFSPITGGYFFLGACRGRTLARFA